MTQTTTADTGQTGARQTAPGQPRHPSVMRLLHWVTALLVLGAIATGVVMVRIESGDLQNTLFNLHRSLGVSALVVIVLRLVLRLRLRDRIPGLPPGMPRMQQVAARGTHHLLYTLTLIQPLIGWIGSSAFGAPVIFFGLFTLPALWGRSETVADVTLSVHVVLAFVMIGLIALHVAAAIHHHVVRRDGLMRRMWPPV